MIPKPRAVHPALCTIAASMAAAGPIPAAAQDQDAAIEDATVDEIIVTGTRLETTLQDADTAATVLTSQALSEARVTDIRRIDDFVPNVQFNESSEVGGVYISIRGIESNPFIVNRAAVYIDGIPFRELSNSVFSELQSVEVLRGPQSTLYGANAESGLIVIRTRPPGDQLEATARLTTATFEAGESYVAEAYVGAPLIEDTLAGSINIKYSDKARFIENIGDTPQGPGEIDEWFVQGRLRFTPSDNVEINAMGYVIDIHAPGVYRFDSAPVDVQRYNEVYSDGILFDPANPVSPPPLNGDVLVGDFNFTNNAPKLAQIEEKAVGISGAVDTGVGSIRAAVSYRSEDADDRGFDVDRTNAPILTGGVVDSKEVVSAELLLQSLGTQSLGYVVGVSAYADEEKESLGSLLVPGGGFDDFVFAPVQSRDSEDVGVFGSLSYTPPSLEDWTFTAGGRYDIAKRTTSQEEGILDLGFTQFFFEEIELEDTFEEFLPRLAVRYRPSENLTWFANAARGYIPGGFNLAATAEEFLGDFVQYESETLWSYDLGLKWRSPERGLRTAAAVFFIEASNWQEITGVFTADGQVGSTSFITSVASIESFGIEVEAEWQPTNALTLTGNFGYVNAEYVDYAEAEPDVVGNPVKYIPEYDGNLAVRYEWESGWFVRAEADFLGRLPLNEGNFGNLQRLGIAGIQTQSATQVFGFQVGYRRGPLLARFFGENVTNERRFSGLGFPSGVFPTDGILYAPLDVPRVFGFEVEINY